VAHEIAHVVLGHGGLEMHNVSREQREAEADALAVSWGFKRRYSRRRLKDISGRDLSE